MGELRPILLAKTALGGGGGALKLGVLRGDAELIQRWTYDKKIVADEGKTIPAYSTSSTTFISGANLDKYTCPENERGLYDYYLIGRCLAIPVYNSETNVAGKCYYTVSYYCYEIDVVNKSLIGNTTRLMATNTATNYFAKYYNSSGDYVIYYATSNYFPAAYFASPTTTINDGAIEITPKSPDLRTRGNATYCSESAWAMLTDIRYQYIVELYKIKKGGSADGGSVGSVLFGAINDINNNNGTLR